MLAKVPKRDAAERSRVDTAPTEVGEAVRLARRHLDRARLTEDPRELGSAQAALKHWWDHPSPPPEVRAMRATLRQRDHDFTSAVEDLKAVVATDPKNGQAWLTLASVELVRGELGAAQEACARLPELVAPLVATTCSASVAGMRGGSVEAIQRLVVELEKRSDVSPQVLGWSISWLAELLERSGDSRGAENAFSAARKVDPSDVYLRYAWADHLLDFQKNEQALEALGQTSEAAAVSAIPDGALLRVAIARVRLGHSGAEAAAAELDRRFARLRARGERSHLREEARHLLQVRRRPSEALTLAMENWNSQREAADVRIAVEAAAAVGPEGREQAQPLLRWVAEQGFEDARLKASLAALTTVGAR
ncbi:MAG: tetratricopeptide repeat protein [Myxococcota bacterium]|nr:tetratricopeptide repeat protein [Myxococcota bacterium]